MHYSNCGWFSVFNYILYGFKSAPYSSWHIWSEVLPFPVRQVSCKVLAVLTQYTSTSNYFWMLCEGIYLHTLIIVAVFVGEQQLFWYYVLGWGESGGSDTSLPFPNISICVSVQAASILWSYPYQTIYMPIITLGKWPRRFRGCLQRQLVVHEDMLPADYTEDYIVTFLTI